MSKISTVFSSDILNKSEMDDRVKELLKLVLDDNVLKKVRTDEHYLLRFLNCCNFDVLATLKRMQDYHNLVIEHPDWFSKASPLEKKKQIEIKDKAYICGRDKSGRPVLVVKLGDMDVSNTCPQEQAQILDSWLELVLDDPQTLESGMSVIVDMNGYSWKFLKWFTPSNIRVAAQKTNLYPFKEILLHVVNTSFLLNTTIKIIWPFLNDKLKNMFKFHFNTWPKLHEYVSPDILPPEYGGSGPEIDLEGSIAILFEHEAVIEKNLKYLENITR